MKKLLILVSIFCALKANAQDYLITFAETGASAAVSTVKVENLTSGKSLIVNGNDILHLTNVITGINSIDHVQSSELKIYPNPMTNYSTLEIIPPVAGDAVITVLDITGKPVGRIQTYLESFRQVFRLTEIKNGFYLINVKGSDYQFSGKLISNGQPNGTISIEKVNNIIQTVDEKEAKTDSKGVQATVDMEYTTGDWLKFTGISGNYNTAKMDIPESNKTITFNFIACSDGDANNYPVVEIGTQVWMVENLKTTKFSDGTDIPLVKINAGWIPLTTPCYGWYFNNEAYKDTRGGLYNWYAVDVPSNSNKNVCPTGWHVPSYVEWVTMENYLIANGYNYNGSNSGNKIALSLAATTSWFMDPEAGMPNGTGPPTYRNKSGFTAIMTGVFAGGDFSEHKGASWWSSTEFTAQSALSSTMSFMSTSLKTGNITSKICGYSVRCIQGEVQLLPVLTTIAISSLKSNTAASGGNISSDGSASITARGVCWSTSPNPTIANNQTINGIGTGEFTSSIYSLHEGTTYYVRAYATNSVGTSYGNELILKTYTGSVMDIERNDYNTIRIGNQVWMAENLRTTKYSDYTAIPLITDAAAWATLSTPGYCRYNNDAAIYKATYGASYNWYAMDAASNGGKNVCPTGWHIPTDAEWTILTDYLIENGYGYQGSGSDIAKSMAAGSGWSIFTTAGTIGNDQASNNSNGITALPGGARDYDGTFGNY